MYIYIYIYIYIYVYRATRWDIPAGRGSRGRFPKMKKIFYILNIFLKIRTYFI